MDHIHKSLTELLSDYLSPTTKTTTIHNINNKDSLISHTLAYSLSKERPLKDKSHINNILFHENFLTLANISIMLKEYKKAQTFINMHKKSKNISTNLSGRTAKLKYFNNIENDFLIIDIEECHTQNMEIYETDKLIFIDYKVYPLKLETQYLLLTELNIIINTESDNSYKQNIIKCYVDRLNYKHNEKCKYVKRFILYFESFVNSEIYYEFKNVLYECGSVSYDCVISLPFINMDEFSKRLADVFLTKHLYTHALDIYKRLGEYGNTIRCYLGLNKEKEAIKELENKTNEYVINENECFSFEEIIEVRDSYMLLAGLTGNIDYYDKAYNVYQTAEPLRLKALNYFENKKYQMASKIFEEALKVTRNEKILFSYGCTLIKLHKYEESIKIFNEILLYDIQNDKAYLNIGNCFMCMRKYREAAIYLDKSIKYNHNKAVVDQFIEVCQKYDLYDLCDKFLARYQHNEKLLEIYKNKIKEYNCNNI